MTEAATQTGGTLLDKIVDMLIAPEVVAFLNQIIIRHPLIIL